MKLQDIIVKAVNGHPDAVAFLMAVHEVADTWDDLIDKDKPVSDDGINRAFYHALVTIPRNPFYRQYFALLSPLVESAILDWYTANALERESLHPETSYGLRCAGQILTVMCSRIVGGVDAALAASMVLRSSGDTWAEYAAKHKVT